jgi:hypothetical protein
VIPISAISLRFWSFLVFLTVHLYTFVILYREYVAAREALCYPSPPLSEGDQGLQAFIDSQNASFKVFLKKLVYANKISDPRLVQEAETLIADRANQLFNYGEELLRIASGGRGRLTGADALQGATEAAGRMWELLWRPEAYAGKHTWESRFAMSAQRGGIRGTVRAVANNLIGHFAQRLRKGRASVSTRQHSQIGDTENTFDVASRANNEEGEWEEWRAAILKELDKDLNDEIKKNQSGKHAEARIRNLRWAIAFAEKQMERPYEWRSMPEVMAEIPELRGVSRGGLQQSLKSLIDDARNRVVAKMGSEKEQAVAHSLQTRGQRKWERTKAEATTVDRGSFREFIGLNSRTLTLAQGASSLLSAPKFGR